MPAHTRRAIDPTPDRLAALLGEVYRSAARESLSGGYDPREGPPTYDDSVPPWTELLAHAAQSPEGVYARRHHVDWRVRHLRFGACWWTDVVGRRHWLVQTDLGDDPQSVGACADEFDQGPGLIEGRHPLEWIAPDLACGWRGRDVAVVCRCGFAGRPEALAWAGTLCGPCFDREQEGLPPAGPTPLRPDVGRLASFVLTPTGALVGATTAANGLHLRVWEPPWSGRPRWTREWSEHQRYAVSPAGLIAVETSPGRVTLVGLNDGRTRDSRELRAEGVLRSLAFAGKDGQLLVGNFQSPGRTVRSALRAWAVTADGRLGAPLYLHQTERPAWPLGVSPRGVRLLVPRGRMVEVRDADDGEVVERVRVPEGGYVCLAVGLPDGSLIAATHIDDLRPPSLFRYRPHGSAAPARGLFDWAVGGGGRSPDAEVRLNGVCEAMAVTADGRRVVTVEDALVLRDTATLKELGRFRPARCDLYPSVGVSPDGQVVALTDRGLAAWPIKELFGA